MIFRALVAGHLRQNRLRTATTIAAIALGVAIVLAIDLANGTAVESFKADATLVSSSTNLQIFGVDRGFDERIFPRIRFLPGVDDAQPLVEGNAAVQHATPNGLHGESVRLLGIDSLQPGTGPTTNLAVDPAIMVNGRGAIVSSALAKRLGVRVGDVLPAATGSKVVPLRVVALLAERGAAFDSSTVFVDVVTAQEAFEKIGRLDRVDLTIQPALLSLVRARIAALLPRGVRIVAPPQRDAEIARMLRSFQLNLAVLSYIALLVAASLVYNAVAVSVVQRREEIGTLRALGATRAQIFRAFLVEGALFGTVGSLIGLAVGAYLAQFSVAAVAQTVSTLYATTRIDGVVFDPMLVARAFVLGVGLAIVSAALPAFVASRTMPATAMRSRGAERSVPLGGRWWILGALGLFALAALAARVPAIDGIPIFGYAAGLACMAAGAACILPGLLVATRWAARQSSALPLAARLAAASLGSNPRRTSVAIGSLMVAVATVVSIATLVGSLRATVIAWGNDTLQADLFVSAPLANGTPADQTLPATSAARIAKIPGVEAVDTFRSVDIPFAGSLTTLAGVDARQFDRRGHLRIVQGPSAHELARTTPDTLQAVASQTLSERYGLRIGDRIPVETRAGLVRLPVVAIISDYSSDAGLVLIDRAAFGRLFDDTSVNSIAVYAQPGADLQMLRARIVERLRPYPVEIQTTRELRRLVRAIFDRTFAITYALYGISLAIAMLGVVGTLFAIVLDRRREIGVLRYLGLTRGGVRRMVLCEAGIVGILGAIYGLGVGLLLALLLTFVIDRQAFGWLVTLEIPWSALAQALGLVVAAALIGGIYPARVAARIRTDEAVRAE